MSQKTTNKISETAKDFITYYFNGDGNYHLVTNGSRCYKQTTAAKFIKNNAGLVKITATGNDAPRGGRTGDFATIEFLPEFYAKYQWFIDQLKAEREAAERRASDKSRQDQISRQIVSEFNDLEQAQDWINNNEGNSEARRKRWNNRANRIGAIGGFGTILRDRCFELINGEEAAAQ